MIEKKTAKADLAKKSGLFLSIGLVISLLLVITAFEWKFYDEGSLVDLGTVDDNFEDMMEIPPTQQPPPPPPVIQQPEIVEVPDEEEIEQEIEVNLDVEITEETVIEDIIFEEAPEEEVADEIFTIVEDQPSFQGGGNAAFLQWVGKNLRYPAQAQRMGLEGRVYVQFVIEREMPGVGGLGPEELKGASRQSCSVLRDLGPEVIPDYVRRDINRTFYDRLDFWNQEMRERDLGAQHAREWITPEMVRRLTYHVIDNYGTDRTITDLVNRTELWFVPVANPDGYDWTFEPGQRMWRKNLRDNNGDGQITGGDGVDLNRNFPTKWGYDNEGSSPNPGSETYRGPAPASEPETQALDGLMDRVDFEFQVNYHSAAELLLWGAGWQVATPTPDDAIYEAMSGDDADPAVPGYDPDISAELYTTNGETTEHAHSTYGTLAFTPEMSTCQTVSDADPDDEWDEGVHKAAFTWGGGPAPWLPGSMKPASARVTGWSSSGGCARRPGPPRPEPPLPASGRNRRPPRRWRPRS